MARPTEAASTRSSTNVAAAVAAGVGVVTALLLGALERPAMAPARLQIAGEQR